MNIPEIAKCPGCRAKVEVANDVKSHPGDNLRVQVCCFLCDYRGPSRYLVEDAIYAHNAICRQPTPEAAETSQVQRASELEEWVIKHSADAAFELGNYRYELERLRLLAHPPKPEPTEARSERQRFEDWYTLTAFDLAANPIGSRDCHLQWTAWWQRALETLAPKPPAERMREELEKLANRIGTAATVNGYDKDTAAVLRAFRDDVRSLAKHYTAPAEGWIKCSDRLPEIGEEVQVYCIESVYPEKPRVKALARFIPYEEATTYYWDSAYGGGNRHTQQAVIAWQPLAAAPKAPA